MRDSPRSDCGERLVAMMSLTRALFFTLLLAQVPAFAQSEQPLWELGLATVAIDQQAYPGSSARSRRQLLVPFGVYRGPLLRAADGEVGLRALRQARLEVDIGFSGAIGSSADAAPLRQGMPRLGNLVEMGPRVKFWPLGRGGSSRLRLDLPLRAVFDLSNQFAFRGFSLEPRISWRIQEGSGPWLRLSAGWILGDRRLADLFYGVGQGFVTPSRPAYEARAGLIATRVGAGFGVPLTRRWFFGGFVRWDDISGAANRASPLVDARGGWSAGVTLAVRLFESQRRASTNGG